MEGLANLFFPYAIKRVSSLNGHLAHYTSVYSASSIIENQELWLSHPKYANDFQEIEYAQRMMKDIFVGEWGERFINVLNAAHGNVGDEVREIFEKYLTTDWKNISDLSNVYMTCFTEHVESEQKLGRLSMWRGYARDNGVALCFSTEPFKQESNKLKIYSSPVFYADFPDFLHQFVKIVLGLEENLTLLKNAEPQQLRISAEYFLIFTLLSTKHPGFREENEWRILYLGEDVGHIEDGEHQEKPIKKFKLANVQSGEIDLNISNIIDRVIIGPIEDSESVKKKLTDSMSIIGMDSESVIIDSEIPYRAEPAIQK